MGEVTGREPAHEFAYGEGAGVHERVHCHGPRDCRRAVSGQGFGGSFYVWVSQIGVILIALAAGAYLGGAGRTAPNACVRIWGSVWVAGLVDGSATGAGPRLIVPIVARHRRRADPCGLAEAGSRAGQRDGLSPRARAGDSAALSDPMVDAEPGQLDVQRGSWRRTRWAGLPGFVTGTCCWT